MQGPSGARCSAPTRRNTACRANLEKLRGAQTEKLNGDYDVFGDGSVVIKATPGHTPGHQSLLVRLPKRGLVLLTGDLVHLAYSWENNVVPASTSTRPRAGAASRR